MGIPILGSCGDDSRTFLIQYSWNPTLTPRENWAPGGARLSRLENSIAACNERFLGIGSRHRQKQTQKQTQGPSPKTGAQEDTE